jgi:hypothetical protein
VTPGAVNAILAGVASRLVSVMVSVAVKLTATTLVLSATDWLAGLKVYPLSFGVRMYFPGGSLAKTYSPLESDIALKVSAPVRLIVADPIPALP